MATESSPVSSPSSPIPDPVSDPTPTTNTDTRITVAALATAVDATHHSSPPNLPLTTVATTTTTTAVRKFPAPCWTQEETMELINAYKDKWYSLRCRNLRSADWEAVATDLNTRCPPSVTPSSASTGSVTTAVPGIINATGAPKTSAQCRHKMEKLRKRYRAEKQRALNHPNRFFASSWIFFDMMDAMETGSCLNGGSGPNLGNLKKGLGAVKVVKKKVVEEDDKGGFDSFGVNVDQKFRQGGMLTGGTSKSNPRDLGSVPIKFKFKNNVSSLGYDDAARFDRHLEVEEENYASGYDSGRVLGGKAVSGSRSGGGGTFDRKFGGKFSTFGGDDDEEDDDDGGDFYDPRFDSKASNGGSGFGKRSRGVSKRSSTAAAGAGMMMVMESDHNPTPSATSNKETSYSVVSEMVRSIKMLGDGFVKMEKMKAEMVREIERTRMEMEMKRSEMILESQQMIVNAFVEGFLGHKKNKKPKLEH